MLSSFLTKSLVSSSSPFYQLVLLNPLLQRHSLSTQAHKEKELPFVAQYLISSFGFSPDRALKYSADSHLAAIKSTERPESVVRFLKDTGLSPDQIQSVVSFYPRFLAYNVDKTLKPKVRQFIDAGFSGELLVQLIRYNPNAFDRKDTLSRLLFWRNFVGNNNEVLLKIIKRNRLLFTFDIDNHVVPKINLFKEYGFSNQDIVSLLGGRNSCMTKSLGSLRQMLELVEELGILHGSGMFMSGFQAIGNFNKDQIKRKVQFFMVTYGWSEDEVHTAFRKYPRILSYSKDKVKLNMDFLIKKAGFEPRNIALRPQLLGNSVERVLVPRYTVLSTLQANGLKQKCSLLSAAVMSEGNFLERYVVPYEKDVPGLGEIYAGAYGGEVAI